MDDQHKHRRAEAVDAWISAERPSESDALARMERYQPTKVKRGLATASVAFGALTFLVILLGVTEFISPVRELLAGTILSLFCAVPGLYWFGANARDAQKISDWDARRRANEVTARYLAPEERHLLGDPDPAPLLTKRRWWLVGVVMFVMFAVTGVILGPVV